MALLMSATDGVNGPPRTSGPGITGEGKLGNLTDWSKFGVNGLPMTSGPGTIDWSTAAGRLPVVKERFPSGECSRRFSHGFREEGVHL